MIRLLTIPKKRHISEGVIFDAREELLESGKFLPRKTPYFLSRFPKRMQILAEKFAYTPEKQLIMAMNVGQLKDACEPEARIRAKQRTLYLFDAWPNDLERIEHGVRHYGISVLLVSDRSATKILASRLPDVQVHWVPEAVSPSFCTCEPDVKAIDLIVFGRSFDGIGMRLKEGLEPLGFTVHARMGEAALEPDEQRFRERLSQSKVTLCFPKTSTHPIGAEWEPKITQRYFQAFISGCLVAGESFQALHEVYGYDPVVPLQRDSLEDGLVKILRDFPKYADLLRRNREATIKFHNWEKRFEPWI